MKYRLLLSVSLQQLIAWLIVYKYMILFPILVFEGPITTVIAGFLVSLGRLNFLIVYITAVTADLVGDTLYYLVGRFGLPLLASRWGGHVRMDTSQIERVKRQFARHVGKTLLTGKLTHGVGGLILFTAGAAEIPYSTFMWYNTLGTLLKSMVLLLAGFYFGHAYQRISDILDGLAAGTVALFLLVLTALLLHNRRHERRA